MGRRSQRGRDVEVSITSRGGVTTIRVEEELRSLATSLFAGLVAGGGAGSTGIVVGIGMTVFQSAPIAGLMWAVVAGGFYALARGIFGSMSAKRERQLSELTERLEQMVSSTAKKPANQIDVIPAPLLTEGTSAGATG
jgi:hypothetical protein